MVVKDNLQETPSNNRRLELRVDKFVEEFLFSEEQLQYTQETVDHIFEYLDESGDNHHLINLNYSVFWLKGLA